MSALQMIDGLLDGTKRVAIIGIGYLGYSNVMQYVKNGVRCVVTDFNTTRLEKFKEGKYPPQNRFLYWECMKEIEYINPRLVEHVEPNAIINKDNLVYLVCTPLDNDPSIRSEWLKKIAALFVKFKEVNQDACKPIVIFEALTSPYTIEKEIIPALAAESIDIENDLILCYAPRRDWYLEELLYHSPDRLFSMTNILFKPDIEKLFSLFGKRAIFCSTITLTEIVENLRIALTYLNSSLLNQMLLAYPEQNMREAGKLLSDKFSGLIPTINNSGENHPLSCQLLLEGAQYPHYLTMLSDTLSTGFSIQQVVIDLIKQRHIKHVCILGLLAHENTAEYTFNPALLLPKMLKDQGLQVRVNDPFMTEEDIKKFTGCESFVFPDGLSGTEALIILGSHSCYKAVSKIQLLAYLASCKYVFDNTGCWERYLFNSSDGFEYKVTGDPFSLLLK